MEPDVTLPPGDLDAHEGPNTALIRLLAAAPAMIALTRGPEHEVVFLNVAFQQAIGGGDRSGLPIREAFPELAAQGSFRTLDRVVTEGRPFYGAEVRRRITNASGAPEDRWFNLALLPFRSPGSEAPGALVHAVEVTAHVRTRQAAESLARRQATLAALSQQALRGATPEDLMQAATDAIATTLGDVRVSLVQRQRDGSFRVRAVTAWEPSLLRPNMLVRGEAAALASYTLTVNEPVVMADAATETRFAVSREQRRAVVVAGVSVPVPGRSRPFGVLGALAASARQFTEDDVHFMEMTASILAAAIGRSRDEQRLRLSEERLRLALSAGRMITFDWDMRANRITWSGDLSPADSATVTEASTFVTTSAMFMETVLPEDRPVLEAALARAAQERRELDVQFRMTLPDAPLRWVHAHGRMLFDANGEPLRMLGLSMDVTARRAAEEAARTSEQRFRSLVQKASDVILVVDREQMVRYASPSIERALGVTPEAITGLPVTTGIHEEDQGMVFAALTRSLATGTPAAPVELRARHADGSWRHLELICTNLLDDPSVAGVVVNARDISERKHLEAALTRQAYYDTLTDLPNRALFMDRLQHALSTAHRRREAMAALFLDLDGFKVVNDSLGHAAGDRLLTAVATRLRACVRPGDTVARFGGDEFTVLLRDIEGEPDARSVAERILAALRPHFIIDGREVFITASIGIAIRTPASADATSDELLREADIALYEAKGAGKAQAIIFRAEMNALALARLDMESELRRALDRGQMEVYYQPEVDLSTGEVVGVEALLRWFHPRLGLVPSIEFIRLAEDTGLILRLGEWVLKEACRQWQQWQQARGDDRPLVMSVNLSAREFASPDLAERIARVLAETGLPPGCLRMEITESVMMQDAESTIQTLRRLRALGVGLALDDFGTGYSSLSYLRRFPVDTLKVDRSFVNELAYDEGTVAIVQAVTALAHALGMAVTAEGIETSQQLTSAWAVHCDRGQGYFFSRPVPAEQISMLLGGLPAIAWRSRAG